MTSNSDSGRFPENSHEKSGRDKAKERFINIPHQLLQGAKDVVKKTGNLGRRNKSRLQRQPTNPVALAATRVYRESIQASLKVLHIVSNPSLYRLSVSERWQMRVVRELKQT